MASVTTGHVWLDEGGVPWLDDTNVKVVEVVLEHLAHGASPEEICDQHRGYLTLAQIHAALSYYYDNQLALDEEIDRQVADYDQRRAVSSDSPVRRRLRAAGKLR